MSAADEFRADRRVQTVCLLILAILALGVVLYLLKPVLVPFVLALFFTYCLTPIVEVQVRRLRLPWIVAIVDTAILGLLLLVLVGVIVVTSVGGMAKNFASYQHKFDELTDHFAESAVLKHLPMQMKIDEDSLSAFLETSVTTAIKSVFAEVTSIVSNGALVVIFMLFLLSGRRNVGQRSPGLLGEIEVRVKRDVIQTVFFSLACGLAVGVTLAVLGVDFAWVFGFLTFLLNFIPSVGSIIATLLPLPVILLTPGLSLTAQVAAVAVPAAVQFVIGNFIQPRVQGASLDLHPVVVLMSLIFFGMIWGMVGAFLATPITAMIKIVLERIPVTRPLALLMAGNLDAVARAGEVQAAESL